MLKKDSLLPLGIVVILIVFTYIVTTPINLVTADLGRHIANGRVFFETKSFAQGNIYSYTYPDYPFLNHHWLSGVIFYLVHKMGGFEAVSLFTTATLLATLVVFLICAIKFGSSWAAVVSAILFLPLTTYRIEVRPELFSSLFAGVFLLVLSSYKWGKLRSRWLFLLPVMSVFWVNLHIYFFLGFFLIGLFWLESLVESIHKSKITENFWVLTIVGILSVVVSLANPGGLYGVARPFAIYQNYGYRVLEEQNVWFLQNVLPLPVLSYYYFSVFVLVASWVLVFITQKRESFTIVRVGLSVVFTALGWLMLRNFSLFGFFAMVVVSSNIKGVGESLSKSSWWIRLSIVIILFVVVFSINTLHWQWKEKDGFGLGLQSGVGDTGEFIKENNLRGRIFNNYDIGGYLIYNLYPKERVFVDNRPDAYPADFFEKYVKAQEDNEKWRQLSSDYGIEAIVFFRNDYTPWGQEFLISRIKDGQWIPVYLDRWVIVFVKKDGVNKELAKKYALPRELFRVE